MKGLISNLGEKIGEFGVPKFYTYTVEGKGVFVHPHAMKYLEELVTHGMDNPGYLRILGQTYVKAINSAIEDVFITRSYKI